MMPTNELMICALKRSMQGVDSGMLLDLVVGLGEEAGWPCGPLQELTRQVVARRLRSLVAAGHAQQVGTGIDDVNRRPVPLWGPTTGYDPDAEVPEPPELTQPGPVGLVPDPYTGMTRVQLLAVINASDDIAGAVGRFIHDMQDVQHRARQRLADAGLEPSA